MGDRKPYRGAIGEGEDPTGYSLPHTEHADGRRQGCGLYAHRIRGDAARMHTKHTQV